MDLRERAVHVVGAVMGMGFVALGMLEALQARQSLEVAQNQPERMWGSLGLIMIGLILVGMSAIDRRNLE